MNTLQVNLDDRQKAFVEAQVAEEGHSTAENYLLALLREAERRKAWRQVEQLVLAGLDTPAEEMTADDWQSLQRRTTAQNSTP